MTCPAMNRVSQARIVAALAGLAIAGLTLAAVMVTPVSAHGSTQRPASRVYTCRFENQNNSMCAAAWSLNSQALYDWMEVNIGDAGGRHQDLIPDGQLCSAGRSKYGAFDQPGEWPVTALTTNGSGLVDLVYENTAPHSTAYYRVYITNAGFDARTDGLGWGDLELVYDSGPLDRASVQTMRAPLPDRSTPAVLYIVWQRSDSPEAFYACSDVTVNAGSGAPTPTNTTAPPPQTTVTTQQVTTLPPSTEPSTSQTTTSVSVQTPSSTSTPDVSSTAVSNPTTQTTASEPETSRTTETTPVTQKPVADTNPSTGKTTTESPATIATTSSEVSATTSIASSTSSTTGSIVPTGADQSEDQLAIDAGASPDGDDAETQTANEEIAAPTSPKPPGNSRGSIVLAMIGLSSTGLVLLGAGLRWPERFFP